MVTKRPPFLTKPYSAYYHTEVPEEDAEITRVGPGTPAGEYLRRFWQPILVAHQVNDGPIAITRFGEELVAFRDGSGRVGLLQLYCSHCGNSMEFGHVEEDGIRCRANGWKFATDGRALDTPGAPTDEVLKERFCQGAYPMTEHGGLIFTYMGPPEKMPDFPMFDLFESPGYHLEPGRHLVPAENGPLPNFKPCNWLQVLDNAADPLHEEIIHATISGIQFRDRNGRLVDELTIPGQGGFVETDSGIITLDIRRVTDDTVWVRNIEYLWPNMAVLGTSPVFPHEWGPGQTEEHTIPLTIFWVVPIDDHNSMEMDLVRVPDGETLKWDNIKSPALESNMGGRDYETMQRFPGDYEAQLSQRPIAVHALEHLGMSDKGVIMMRRGLRKRFQMVQKGQEPPEHALDGKIVTTYGGDTLLKVDRAATPEEDEKLAFRVAMELAKRYVKDPPNISGPAQ